MPGDMNECKKGEQCFFSSYSMNENMFCEWNTTIQSCQFISIDVVFFFFSVCWYQNWSGGEARCHESINNAGTSIGVSNHMMMNIFKVVKSFDIENSLRRIHSTGWLVNGKEIFMTLSTVIKNSTDTRRLRVYEFSLIDFSAFFYGSSFFWKMSPNGIPWTQAARILLQFFKPQIRTSL